MSPTMSSCTPNSTKCNSSISQDLRTCYTSQDLSYESRACDGDWKPIYTGEYCRTCSLMGCRAVSGCNEYTCYPPSCEDLPPDVPYHPTNRARETFLIIALVLVVVGVVGGIVGGVLCCWCAKCCCFAKKKPVAAATATATATELVATATAVPVAVPTATRFPS